MRVGPYQVTIRPGALVVPGLCMGYGLYQYLTVRQLPDSKINLVLIEPVFILMVVFTVCVLVREGRIWREKDREQAREGASPALGTIRSRLLSSTTRKAAAFVLLSGLYLGLIQPVGFIPCNLAFLVASMLLLGVRKWHLLVIIPVAATGAIYLLFQMWMQVPIPHGFLGFLQ